MTFPQIVLPEPVSEINNQIFYSSSDTLSVILNQWPTILAALGLVIIGFFFAWIIRFIMKKIGQKIAIHHISDKIGFTRLLEKAAIQSTPSEIIGKFLGGWVFTMFFLAATRILQLEDIANFLDNLLYHFIPRMIVALLIVLIGLQIARTSSAIIGSTFNFIDKGAARIMQLVAKNIIILFSVLAALLQLNIAEDLVKILFTGVVAMIALGGGLAFGLGAKDFVKQIFETLQTPEDYND